MEPAVIIGSAAVASAPIVLFWAVSGQRKTRRVDLAGDAQFAEVDRPRDLRTLLLREGVGDRALRPMIERVGEKVRRSMPAGRTAALDRKIQRAGAPGGWTIERVLAAKVLLAVLLGGLMLIRFAVAPSGGALLIFIIATLFGYFLPDGLLDSKVNKRQLAIRGEVADTIDQLGVMVRAGLGIDAAIARTARAGNGPLAQELNRVVQEMRVGVNRSVALNNLAERVDVQELRSFVSALSQAERMGVPVSETLHIQSVDMRIKRRQLAEEQAMKLPVKILFPMVVCILPVLFIALLGPAAIRIYEQIIK